MIEYTVRVPQERGMGENNESDFSFIGWIAFMLLIAFVFEGEPSIYDLAHDKVIAILSTEGGEGVD
jgi:hypothetical protein